MENSNRRMTRTVGLVGVIGVSIAGMAPTLAMNLNPQQLAGHVGSAVPLVFALATVAVLLIAWCFARLSRVYPTSGSVYRYVGETLGVRTGVVSGWSMLGAYFCFAGLVISGFAIFMSSLLDATGIWSGAFVATDTALREAPPILFAALARIPIAHMTSSTSSSG